MPIQWGKWDAAILGGIAGLLATKAEIAVWFSNLLAKIIPLNWLVFGDWSIPIFGIIVGIIIGYLVERSK